MSLVWALAVIRASSWLTFFNDKSIQQFIKKGEKL